jgi:hypothetical protein
VSPFISSLAVADQPVYQAVAELDFGFPFDLDVGYFHIHYPNFVSHSFTAARTRGPLNTNTVT